MADNPVDLWLSRAANLWALLPAGMIGVLLGWWGKVSYGWPPPLYLGLGLFSLGGSMMVWQWIAPRLRQSKHGVDPPSLPHHDAELALARVAERCRPHAGNRPLPEVMNDLRAIHQIVREYEASQMSPRKALAKDHDERYPK